MTELRKPTAPAEKKHYRSVAEMVRDVVEDKTFADDFDARLAERQVIKYLLALRSVRGISQQKVAQMLACTQSRVSKLENGVDADLRLGDLVRYAGALGFKTEILLAPNGWTMADEVKYHASCIKKHLDNLAAFATTDHTIAKGVAGFLNEAHFNLVRIVQDAARTVVASLKIFRGNTQPPCRTKASVHIGMKEVEEEQPSTALS